MIRFEEVTAEISDKRLLKDISWEIGPGEFWVVLGANASGKSAAGRLLSGRLDVISGKVSGLPDRTGYVSFERHAEIMDLEMRNDDTDYMDRIDPGTPVSCFIGGSDEALRNPKTLEKVEALAGMFGISHLLGRGIRFLSTGEIRRAMICQALMDDPPFLILDEPFDGLDVDSKKAVTAAITALHLKGVRVVLVLNRFSEISEAVTHIAYISDCRVKAMGKKEAVLGSGALEKLHALHLLPDKLPRLDEATAAPLLPEGTPLVVMKEVTVTYDEKIVLDRVSWTVGPGSHWKISGPNGAGKSTLLSLVSGDNPQAYCNDITLFGRRRGTGESIWDIKKHTGIVSSRFQLDYRVSSTVAGVVISGFFDSIGVYEKPTPLQKEIALDWLKIIGMEAQSGEPFGRLSYGEQRMVLIARAMVKHPHLLILDEPCQGLDEINRNMVLKLIDHLGHTGESTLLYVTHHEEDFLSCITDHLTFVPGCGGKMAVEITKG